MLTLKLLRENPEFVIERLQVKHFYAKEMTEYGFIDEGLAFSNLETHGIDEDTIIDGRRGIARKE